MEHLNLTIELNASELTELHQNLTETFSDHGKEFRLKHADQWTLYFKIKSTGQSRFSASRPSLEEWVGMLHFSEAHAKSFLQSLLELSSGNTKEFKLSTLKPVAAFSNLLLVIRLK